MQFIWNLRIIIYANLFISYICKYAQYIYAHFSTRNLVHVCKVFINQLKPKTDKHIYVFIINLKFVSNYSKIFIKSPIHQKLPKKYPLILPNYLE